MRSGWKLTGEHRALAGAARSIIRRGSPTSCGADPVEPERARA
jgi:hypothetical protein